MNKTPQNLDEATTVDNKSTMNKNPQNVDEATTVEPQSLDNTSLNDNERTKSKQSKKKETRKQRTDSSKRKYTSFDKWFVYLKSFNRKFGHCSPGYNTVLTVGSKNDKEVAIGRWVSKIRGAYKKYRREENCGGNVHISAYEIQRLEVSMIIFCLVSFMYILNPLHFLPNLVLLSACAKSINFNFKYQ